MNSIFLNMLRKNYGQAVVILRHGLKKHYYYLTALFTCNRCRLMVQVF